MEPLIKVLAPGWERAFGAGKTTTLNAFTIDATVEINNFHKTVIKRLPAGVVTPRLRYLEQQQKHYVELVKTTADLLSAEIDTRQCEINRQFKPEVRKRMEHAYNACHERKGTGSGKAVKEIMLDWVQRIRDQIFRKSIRAVEESLKSMMTQMRKTMRESITERHRVIARDYHHALLDKDETESVEGRALRQAIAKILVGIEAKRHQVAGQGRGRCEGEGEGEGEGEVNGQGEEGGDEEVDEEEDSEEGGGQGRGGQTKTVRRKRNRMMVPPMVMMVILHPQQKYQIE